MSPELRMIERTCDAIGRALVESGLSGTDPRPALAPYARSIRLALGALATQEALAEIGRKAATPRRGGIRWIVSERERAAAAEIDALRGKAADALDALEGGAPEGGAPESGEPRPHQPHGRGTLHMLLTRLSEAISGNAKARRDAA